MGQIRKLDSRNRLTIPLDYMKQLFGLSKKPKAFDITFTGDSIVLKPYYNHCQVCGKDVKHYRILCVCDDCMKK